MTVCIKQRSIAMIAGICFVILPLFVASSTAQDPQVREPQAADGTLAWKFKEGQVLTMKMKQDVNMNMDMGVQKMETTNNSVSVMTLSIKSVDEAGVATVTNVIDQMKIEAATPGALIEYDSNSDEAPEGAAAEIANVIKPMIGAEVVQKMGPNGKIFDIEIPESMLEGIRQGNPMMAQMFNENTIKEMTSKASLVFPENKLAVGDKWENVAEVAMGPASVKTVTNYEYLGVSDATGKALHLIRGIVEMSFPEGIQGMDVDITEEDSTIYFYFDGNAGRLAKSELDQNVTMEISLGPQSISQVLKQKMTMEVSEE